MSRTFYVAPEGNDCWNGLLNEPNPNGTDGPFRTIDRANSAAAAGDTVVIRGGRYRGPICPVNSGEKNRPITYRNYENETVLICEGQRITGLTQDEQRLVADDLFGLYIYRKSYIVIDGINIDFTPMGRDYVSRWGRVVNSDHITIKNCVFRHAIGNYSRGGIDSSGSVLFINSHYNRIISNVLDDGNDNLLLVQSDHNLVEGNIFTRGRHTLWCIRAGNFNIIRNNYFHNELQKIGEIYDNGTWSAKRYGTLAQDAAKHNIVENNVFAYTPLDEKGGPYSGIQFAGQNCIIRGNIFHDVGGGGIALTMYGDEAYYNYNNRVYNNTFVKNQCGGISISHKNNIAPNYFFYNNIIKNNILYNNIYMEKGTRHDFPDFVKLRGKPVQVWGVRYDGFHMTHNNIFSESGEKDYTVAHGRGTEHYSVEWMEQNYPYLFSDNMSVDPGFVKVDKDYDPTIPFSAKHDFRLREDSPLKEGGCFLARVIPFMMEGRDGPPEGRDAEIAVDDPLCFSDGFGIVEGDRIKLQNGETAIIKKIRYGIRHNRLVLDREINWKSGDGVSLYFEGRAPYMGALGTREKISVLSRG